MSFRNAGRLQQLEEVQIGLVRGPVVQLVEHNEKWKRVFSDEAYFIYDQLRDESLRLFHIGSTSVPNILTKPIIDILGSVKSLSKLDKRKEIFEAIGYEYKGEYGIKGRRFCVLYNPDKTIAFVNLHIFEHSDSEIMMHLRFRDYLRGNQSASKEYENHKIELVSNQRIERSKYSDAKGDLISKLQNEANSYKILDRKIFAIIGAADGHENTKKYLQQKFDGENLEIVDLLDLGLEPYSYGEIPDDRLIATIEKVIQADLAVFATPVYWYTMSGAMKNFIDRFSDLLSGRSKVLGESLYGKKFQVLSTGYDTNPPFGFEVPFAGTAIYFGMDYLGLDYISARRETL